MGVSYGKGDKAKATKLHAEIVRSIGVCESCGSSNYLQCAHIISRRYSATRTLLNNAQALCAGCHRRYTDHPLEFSRYISTTPIRAVYDQMYQLSQQNRKYPKTYWSERLAQLKQVKADIDKGQTLADARAQEAEREGLI